MWSPNELENTPDGKDLRKAIKQLESNGCVVNLVGDSGVPFITESLQGPKTNPIYGDIDDFYVRLLCRERELWEQIGGDVQEIVMICARRLVSTPNLSLRAFTADRLKSIRALDIMQNDLRIAFFLLRASIGHTIPMSKGEWFLWDVGPDQNAQSKMTAVGGVEIGVLPVDGAQRCLETMRHSTLKPEHVLHGRRDFFRESCFHSRNACTECDNMLQLWYRWRDHQFKSTDASLPISYEGSERPRKSNTESGHSTIPPHSEEQKHSEQEEFISSSVSYAAEPLRRPRVKPRSEVLDLSTERLQQTDFWRSPSRKRKAEDVGITSINSESPPQRSRRDPMSPKLSDLPPRDADLVCGPPA